MKNEKLNMKKYEEKMKNFIKKFQEELLRDRRLKVLFSKKFNMI